MYDNVFYQPIVSELRAAVGMALCMIDVIMVPPACWLAETASEFAYLPYASKCANEHKTTFKFVFMFYFFFVFSALTLLVGWQEGH